MIKILCTVGPATINSLALKKLEKENVALLRINLSHSSLKELKSYIDIIQNNVNIPICIDSEGAQIRTGIFHNGTITLRTNKQIKLISGRESNNDSEIFADISADIEPLRCPVSKTIALFVFFMDLKRVL